MGASPSCGASSSCGASPSCDASKSACGAPLFCDASKSAKSSFSSSIGSFFIESAAFASISVKSTPSFSITVSNCAKGLFTMSFKVASGVKVILSRPESSMASPVFTSTLFRALIRITLNVPNPFTLTIFSYLRASFTTSNITVRNSWAAAGVMPRFCAMAWASSFIVFLPIVIFLLSVSL